MKIAKDTVVTLHYQVTDPDGEMVDEGRDDIVYVHGGYEGIFPKIEQALDGRNIGDRIQVKLDPAEAFGEYDAELVILEDTSMLPAGLEVGQQVERCSDDETELFTVTDIAGDKAVLDGNHPLAGMALIFTATIADVRPARPEEIPVSDDGETRH